MGCTAGAAGGVVVRAVMRRCWLAREFVMEGQAVLGRETADWDGQWRMSDFGHFHGMCVREVAFFATGSVFFTLAAPAPCSFSDCKTVSCAFTDGKQCWLVR